MQMAVLDKIIWDCGEMMKNKSSLKASSIDASIEQTSEELKQKEHIVKKLIKVPKIEPKVYL